MKPVWAASLVSSCRTNPLDRQVLRNISPRFLQSRSAAPPRLCLTPLRPPSETKRLASLLSAAVVTPGGSLLAIRHSDQMHKRQRPAYAVWWWIALSTLVFARTILYIPRDFANVAADAGVAVAHADPQHHHHHTSNSSSSKSYSNGKACLAMIMKNEGLILPRLFQSVHGFVSEYCIVDTGSTDDTLKVLKSMNMPGLIVEEPFVNFATTRNFLLDTCWAKTDCEYLLLLDSDMVLRVSTEWDWRKLNSKDVYDIIQVSSIEYHNVRMLRRTTSGAVRVVGATHEYYNVPREYSHKLLPKRLIYIEDIGDGLAKQDKFQRDERLLRAEVKNEPNNARAVFYLANTLKDQGKYADAIPFYERRSTMIGWAAEAEYSLYMLSTCYLGLDDVERARKSAEEAALTRVRNKRAEPLYFLALYLHRHAKYELAWHYAKLAATIPRPSVTSTLFVSTDIYDYWIAYEQASLCPYVLSNDPQCVQVMTEFLSNANAPEDLRTFIRKQIKGAEKQLRMQATGKT